MRRCRCGKRTFRDRAAALVALAEIQRKDRPTARERRVYKCRYQRWHLTSQEER